ncbi:MAG: cytochrome b/b6 domain-containing protein [Woeseiaceae bacterium]|nr:cytochrome b/b6 domain-containing protein [Woeseiaceae bacterium]
MTASLRPKGARTLRESAQTNESSTLIDHAENYGWISILLHWLTAAALIAIWIIGKSILGGNSTEVDARRALHVSVAGSMWLVVLFRVAWRFRSGHPRVRGLATRTHYLAMSVHYVVLVLLVAMLISGPVMVWADGHAVVLFDTLTIPAPFAESESTRSLAWTLHSQAALALAILVILHIAAALKHLMFHSDDTIIRMLWPGKNTENQ